MPFKGPGLFDNNPAAQRLPDPQKRPDFLERLRVRDGRPSTPNAETATNNKTEEIVLRKIVRKVVFTVAGAVLIASVVPALMLGTFLIDQGGDRQKR